MRLEALIDIATVKRTELLGDAKNVISAFFSTPDKHPDDQWADQSPTDESEPVDCWQQYGFVSRLPKGAQAVLLRWGENTFAIASRVMVAARVFGQLAEGDVALFALPGNMIKLGADGSIVFRVPTDNGQDMVLVLSGKDGGSLKFVIPSGPAVEWSAKNGITHNAGDKPVTNSSTTKIQNIAAQMVDEVGVHKLHMAASKPMVGVACLAAPNLFV
jgi:phage gp45-like